MGMPLELNTMIVTKDRESRLEENLFSLIKDGYRLYPLEVPIEIKRTLGGDTCGVALIKKVEWENSKTTIQYELVSLNSTN